MTAEHQTRNGAKCAGAAGNYASIGAQRARTAADAMYQAQREAQAVIKQFNGATQAQNAGRVAEHWHQGTFNADAALKGRTDILARTRPPAGPAAAGPDLVVTRAGKDVAQAQVKYYKSAAGTANAQSQKAYNGMQKIAPSDQAAKVKALASVRSRTGTLKAGEFADTARNTTDRLKADGVSSSPLSKAEAEALVRNPGRIGTRGLMIEATQAARGGAIVGASVSTVVSAVSNVSAAMRGEKSAAEATAGIAVDAAKGAGTGAVMGAGSAVARSALVKLGAGALARSAAPVAIAATVLDAAGATVDEVKAFARGEINGGELAVRTVAHTGKAAVKGGAAWGGTELGAFIGTAICPGVGTVIGGAIGGITGYLFGSSLFKG